MNHRILVPLGLNYLRPCRFFGCSILVLRGWALEVLSCSWQPAVSVSRFSGFSVVSLEFSPTREFAVEWLRGKATRHVISRTHLHRRCGRRIPPRLPAGSD